MDKNVPLVIITGYETITLFLAELLYSTFECHGTKNLLKTKFTELKVAKVRRPPFCVPKLLL